MSIRFPFFNDNNFEKKLLPEVGRDNLCPIDTPKCQKKNLNIKLHKIDTKSCKKYFIKIPSLGQLGSLMSWTKSSEFFSFPTILTRPDLNAGMEGRLVGSFDHPRLIKYVNSGGKSSGISGFLSWSLALLWFS